MSSIVPVHTFIGIAATLVVGALQLTGCASVRYAGVELDARGVARTTAPEPGLEARIAALSAALNQLGPGTNPAEAARIARAAVLYPMHLANEYRLVSPPLLHNTLVNSGLRPRGLCREWTEDLLDHLAALDLRSFDLYWGVAHKGSYYGEHSSVIVTAKGQPFEEGIVLDGWRDSGRLYWGRVREDRYPWQRYRGPEELAARRPIRLPGAGDGPFSGG